MRKFNKAQVFFLIGAVLFTALFLFSGIMAMRQYKDTKQSAEAFNSVADLVKPAPTPVLTSVEDATGEDGTDTPASYEPASELTAYDKYAAVYEQNSDFIGWISIEDTKINYPVMQTPGSKDFYLKHAFDKSYSEYGVPYMQENCKLGLSDNCVIYGHHMQDGSMFADLCKFESEDFYKEHKTIHFDTLAGFGEYEIVFVFKTAAYAADGFKYYHFVDAADAAEFNSFLSSCKSLALYDTGESAEYGDKLITLSTCEYSRSNGRMVIVAKLVQPAADEVGGNG